MGNLGRFQFVAGRPVLNPGKCVTCGSSSAKDYVQFSLSIDRYGVVYICIECFKGACVDLLDLVEKFKLIQAQKYIKELEEENKELKDALAAFGNLRSILGSFDILGVGTDPVAEVESSSVENSDGDDKPPVEPESELVESFDESGSANVQHSNNSDELLNLI